MHVIGTAGHVDHGKSTLVRALTGIDPDRLREEKERGMTIDLGFAWLALPGGEEISIVDVPGHERFIKNMLAGVGGIDLALLVVAADEGVMPQTVEHVQILDLLRVRRAVVAITKVDAVDPVRLEQVHADVEEYLGRTGPAGPGSRVAVNLVGGSTERVGRGQVVAAPGGLRPTTAVDVSLAVLGDAPPLLHGAILTFHAGSAEVEGRVLLLEGEALAPGTA